MPVFVQYEIIQFVLFCTWLFLLGIMLVYSSILQHVVVDFSFLVLYSHVWIYNNLLFATLDGHLGILKWWFLKGHKGALVSKHTFPPNLLHGLKFLMKIFPVIKHINCMLIHGLLHSCLSCLHSAPSSLLCYFPLLLLLVMLKYFLFFFSICINNFFPSFFFTVTLNYFCLFSLCFILYIFCC